MKCKPWRAGTERSFRSNHGGWWVVSVIIVTVAAARLDLRHGEQRSSVRAASIRRSIAFWNDRHKLHSHP